MARISKYRNEMTDISAEIAKKAQEEALKMTIEYIENKQMKYGISDAQLSDFLNIDRAVMSMYKTKGIIPKYYLASVYLLFQYLETNLRK